MVVIKTPTKKKLRKLENFLGKKTGTIKYGSARDFLYTKFVIIDKNGSITYSSGMSFKDNYPNIKPISVKKYIAQCKKKSTFIKDVPHSEDEIPKITKTECVELMKKNGDMLIEKYKNKQLRIASPECEEKVKLLQQRIRTLEILLSVEIEHLKNRNLWDRIFNV